MGSTSANCGARRPTFLIGHKTTAGDHDNYLVLVVMPVTPGSAELDASTEIATDWTSASNRMRTAHPANGGRATDPRLDVHLILDNYGTHRHPQVMKWFSAHPRYHPHFTPTSAWLNQVERWFAEITRKRIRRGTFHSVPELVKAIQGYIRENNKNPQPMGGERERYYSQGEKV